MAIIQRFFAVSLLAITACHTAAPARHDRGDFHTWCNTGELAGEVKLKTAPTQDAPVIIIPFTPGCHRVEAMYEDHLPSVRGRWYRVEIDGRIAWDYGPLDWGNHRAEKFTAPAGAPGPRMRWKVPFDYRFGKHAPVITGGTVLLKPMSNRDGIEYLTALDAKTGREKWKVRNDVYLRQDISTDGKRIYMGGLRGVYIYNVETGRRDGWIRFVHGQGNVEHVTLHRGVLYTHSDEGHFSSEPVGGNSINCLSAIDPATHRFIWKKKMPDDWGWQTEVHNGVLYQYGGEEKLVALSASTGRVIWTRSYGFPLYSVTGGDGMLCVTGQVIEARRVAASIVMGVEEKTGEMKWEYHKWTSRPLIADGTVYFGNRHYLCALDAKTGEKKWERDMGKRVGTVTIAGGVLYVRMGPDIAVEENYVVAVDPKSGSGIWKYGPMPYGRTGFFPVIDNGSMYFYGNDFEALYAFDLP